MEIKELTEVMHRFVEAKGWYNPESLRPQTPRNIAISLNIESAEVLEHFQWTEAPLDRDALAGELADVTLYLLQLASVTGIDLEQAVLDKLKVNYGRTWDEDRKSQGKEEREP
ncbi:MAG: nucleotide pyrophosphohydrolase [Chloroflexi bacterium]|nr:nucleotide pyrophosphohydrolase [Chloroflexota bacterium]